MQMDHLIEYRNAHFQNPFTKNFREFKGCLLTPAFERLQDKIYNMKVREEDVWVITFPKSGTTWTQEMVWMILNNLDFAKGMTATVNERAPCIELSAAIDIETGTKEDPDLTKNIKFPQRIQDSWAYVQNKINSEAQVAIKCHLPWQLLPKEIQNGTKKPKIIYVARNPKDIVVSYFHNDQRWVGYTGTIEMYCELFLAGKVHYSPYWQHILPFWGKRHDSNILFLTYEDMSNDLSSVIRKVAKYLGKILNDSQVALLADHLNFENMKKNPCANNAPMGPWIMNYAPSIASPFMRKGKVGSYKESLSPEMIARFDSWIDENTKGTGLCFQC